MLNGLTYLGTQMTLMYFKIYYANNLPACISAKIPI